ncbi:YncE family protein [Rhodococcus qingshengii]|uniref:YncE family protein n=1 Tax=Rhodococcus qingshengii TaxID=334542 RepID=UPI00301A2250
MSPDSSRLYVAVTGLQGALQVFDTGTNAVKAAMSVDSMPMGMAWNPNGFLLYLAVSGTSRFVVSDTTTNQSVGLFAAGVGAVDAVITPDGKTLYASDIGDNTLTVFDITAPDLSGTPPTGRVDELYSYAFALAGSPYAWTDPVMLPPGVVLSPAGVISGTPTQVGMFTVTVEAKNYNTRAISRQVTITIADVDSCTNGSSGPSSGSWLGQPGAGGNGSLSSGSAGSSGGC